MSEEIFRQGRDAEHKDDQPRLPCGRPRLKRMVSLLGLNRRRADALLSYAADLNAEMLVVGGSGHSRLRELILGGVTRELLRDMTLPVLRASLATVPKVRGWR